MELRRTEIEVNELVQLYKSLVCYNKQLKPWWENGDNNNDGSSNGEPTGEGDTMEECKEEPNPKEHQQKHQESTFSFTITQETMENDAFSILTLLQTMQSRMQQLFPITDKFRQRMTMKDPITNAPRYGEQTLKRVHQLLQRYDALKIRMEDAFGVGMDNDNKDGGDDDVPKSSSSPSLSVVHHLQQRIQLQKERQEAEQQLKLMELESTLREQEQLRIQAEETWKQEQAQEQARLQQERQDLAKRAEISRKERMEHERKVVEEEMRRYQMEKEADEAFLASVHKGVDGVKEQLNILRQSCGTSSNPDELQTALGALHTLFSQILSNPEEVKFRRIRRDHPQFLNDIGRHEGGKQILVAAGFTFAEVEGVKCFFSKEPDIEKDMDGWSNWFNLIKSTLSAIEEEMMK